MPISGTHIDAKGKLYHIECAGGEACAKVNFNEISWKTHIFSVEELSTKLAFKQPIVCGIKNASNALTVAAGT